MKIAELARLVRAPFAEIFPTPPLVLDAVTEAMRTWGYDNSQPILWRARETGKPVFFKPNLTIQPREYPERSQN